jgi:hypothetical protein
LLSVYSEREQVWLFPLFSSSSQINSQQVCQQNSYNCLISVQVFVPILFFLFSYLCSKCFGSVIVYVWFFFSFNYIAFIVDFQPWCFLIQSHKLNSSTQ